MTPATYTFQIDQNDSRALREAIVSGGAVGWRGVAEYWPYMLVASTNKFLSQICSALVLVLLFYQIPETSAPFSMLLVALLFGYLFCVAEGSLMIRYMTAAIEQSRALTKPFTHELSADGLRIHSEYSNGMTKWEAVTGIKRGKHALSIVVAMSAYYIPLTAIGSEDDITAHTFDIDTWLKAAHA